jgi:LCP family protein required for cell wall assembly
MKRIFTKLIILFLALLITSGTVIYLYLNSFSSKNDKNSGSYIDAKEVKSGEAFNVLLLGVDIGTVGVKNGPKRSDTMIVIHYDPKTADVSMVSIPRDTKVTLNGRTEKINAANVYGGTSLAIKTVEQLMDININYYVEVDYEAFRKVIDAIGGIDIVIPYNMDYDAESQDLHIHFKKGEKVHLDGKKAEEFVRWRKNNDGTGYADGDLGRIRTQQEFIIKVLEKVKSPSIVLKVPSIAKILTEHIETNMEPMDILNLSKDISKIDAGSVQKYTLQGEDKTINGLSYFVYSPEKNTDIVSLIGGKTGSGSGNEAGTNNKNIRVQVLNGSGLNGAASKIKDELEEKGFNVVGTGNISGTKFTSSHIIDKTLKGNNANR